MTLPYDPMNFVICGIGGQGNILASGLLGAALGEQGYLVSVGETYGASQRGGSVMSHVRVSAEQELGVLVPARSAHVIVGFEPLEALRRAREYGYAETDVIYDPRQTYPLGVLGGEDVYPALSEIDAELRRRCRNVFAIPATELAMEIGNSKIANIILMGALSALPGVPVSSEEYHDALAQNFSGKTLELNIRAFTIGADALRAQL